jgi:hypothetical protein
MNHNPSYPTEKVNDDNEDRGLPVPSSLSVGLTQKSIVSYSLHQFLNLCNCHRR